MRETSWRRDEKTASVVMDAIKRHSGLLRDQQSRHRDVADAQSSSLTLRDFRESLGAGDGGLPPPDRRRRRRRATSSGVVVECIFSCAGCWIDSHVSPRKSRVQRQQGGIDEAARKGEEKRSLKTFSH